MNLDPRRAAIISEAETWIGTKYHHGARLKGAGADCLLFIVAVYEAVGIVQNVPIPFYRPDFMRHTAKEVYLEGLLQYGHEVAAPLPGDVAVYKWGRIYAHAGIVVDWPWILHAAPHVGVIRMRGNTGRLAGRNVKFLSAFEDGEPV